MRRKGRRDRVVRCLWRRCNPIRCVMMILSGCRWSVLHLWLLGRVCLWLWHRWVCVCEVTLWRACVHHGLHRSWLMRSLSGCVCVRGWHRSGSQLEGGRALAVWAGNRAVRVVPARVRVLHGCAAESAGALRYHHWRMCVWLCVLLLRWHRAHYGRCACRRRQSVCVRVRERGL